MSYIQMATCFLTANGIKMTVEDAKCMQANAFIQSGLFDEYQCRKSSAIFMINLSVLLVCFVCKHDFFIYIPVYLFKKFSIKGSFLVVMYMYLELQ